MPQQNSNYVYLRIERNDLSELIRSFILFHELSYFINYQLLGFLNFIGIITLGIPTLSYQIKLTGIYN